MGARARPSLAAGVPDRERSSIEEGASESGFQHRAEIRVKSPGEKIREWTERRNRSRGEGFADAKTLPTSDSTASKRIRELQSGSGVPRTRMAMVRQDCPTGGRSGGAKESSHGCLPRGCKRTEASGEQERRSRPR